MDRERGAILAVCGIIALTAVAFGPLVSGLSLEDASDSQSESTDRGSLTVESVSFPSTALIEPTSYGAANHYVSAPPATVRIDSISGSPLLSYQLRIESLGVQLSTVHFLDETTDPAYEVTIDPATMDLDLGDEEYTGELSIIVIDSSGRRTVANQTVPVGWDR